MNVLGTETLGYSIGMEANRADATIVMPIAFKLSCERLS